MDGQKERGNSPSHRTILNMLLEVKSKGAEGHRQPDPLPNTRVGIDIGNRGAHADNLQRIVGT